MIYRLPEIEDKDILNDYVQEHFAFGKSSISASMGYFSEYWEESAPNAERLWMG